MKILRHFAAIALAGFACMSLRAEETKEQPKEIEWVVTLGCQHCHYSKETGINTCVGNCAAAGKYEDKVYFLKGNTPKDYAKGGEWLVKGTLSDGKTIQVKEMKMVAVVSEEKVKAEVEKAKAAGPAKVKLQEWSGTVFKTGKALPGLLCGEQKYGMKPSETADAAVRTTLTKIGGAEFTGKFTVTGTTYEDDARKWIVVEMIQAAKDEEQKTTSPEKAK